MKDKVAEVRSSAARAIGLLARDAPSVEKKKAVSALGAALKDVDGEVRGSVAITGCPQTEVTEA